MALATWSTSSKLIEQLKGCEQKIEELHNNSAIYVCRKKDTIDESLGAFLNQYPERGKLQILFIRESEGVYQFGQRCVYVKVEKDENDNEINVFDDSIETNIEGNTYKILNLYVGKMINNIEIPIKFKSFTQ